MWYAALESLLHPGAALFPFEARVSQQISDDGIGIPSGDLPSIFQRFYRSENARLTGAPGSGLGLAIARWIVDSHHAKIDLQSTPERGTTFRVSFSAFTFVSETLI